MAAEDVGGIQAQVTADASGFLATLQKAEAAAKEFDARYGKINVVITATLRMPTQTAIREYQRDLQRAIEREAPARVAPQPAAASAAAAAGVPAAAAPIRRATTQTVAAQAPAAVVTAAPVIDAAAEARATAAAQAKAAASRAQAQATANATGRTVNWTDVGQVTRTVRPERTTGGAVGSAGETVHTGSRSTTTIASFGPRPQEFAGRRGGTRGIDSEGGDFQGLQEQAGKSAAEVERLSRELEDLKAGVPLTAAHARHRGSAAREAAAGARHPGAPRIAEEAAAGQPLTEEEVMAEGARRQLSEAQLEARRAGGRARAAQAAAQVGGGRVAGAFAPVEEGPVIITRASQRAAQTAATGTAPPIRRAPAQERAAAEEDLYTPPAVTEEEREKTLFLTTLDEFPGTPEEKRAALAELERTNPPGRRGRGRTAPVTTAAPRTLRRRLSPQQRAGAQAALSEQAVSGETEQVLTQGQGETSVGDLAAILEEAETRNIRSQQRTQQRALGTTLGGGITTLLGGAQAADLRIEANRAVIEARGFQKDLNAAKARELEIIKDLDAEQNPAKQAVIQQDLDKQRESIDEISASYEDATLNARDLSLQADAAAKGGLRNITGAFTGALIGSLAFGVGMTAVTVAMEAVGKASREGIGVLTGWRDIANETSEALAQQTIQLHGLVEVAVASNFAQTAISQRAADTIRPLLEQRVALEAGSKAFSGQIDLIHAWANLQQQVIQGGPIPGISTGIGGVAGTQVFAQPGIIEQLSRLTPRGQNIERGVGGLAIGAGVGGAIGAGVGLLGGPFAGISVPAGLAIGSALGGLVGGAIPQVTGPTSPLQFGVSQNPRIAVQQADERAQVAALSLDVLNVAVTDLNDAAQRGSRGVENLGQAITGSTDQAEIERTSQLLAGLDVPEDQRQRLADAGFVLKDIFSVEGATNFFKAAARGATIPVASEVLQQLREQVIPARLFQLTRQSELQRSLIGIQTGVQRAAQPFLPLGTTVPPPGPPGSNIPGGLAAVSPELQGAIGNAQKYDNLTVQRIQAARVEIGNLALPGQRAGALASFDRLQGLGQERAGIQTFITQSQVNLVTAQYNEQLRQARLQLGDLAVLTGRVTSSGGDNLGVLEKQNIQYQRANALLQIQLSTLQLELQQRQINFQVAIAGFTAPGVTGAERAARIEQAELEASYAQQQLDIQRQILQNQAQSVPLQIQIQDIQFNRDYQTALNAINLLTQGRQVNIDVAAAQEAIQRIDAQIEEETAKLQTFIQAGAQAAAAIIADQAKFIETYTTATQDLQESAAAFFSGISSEYADGLIRFLTRVNSHVANMFGGGGYTGGTYARQREGGAQTGFYGTVNDRTQITVGEAGAETVAILRNPREMMWGGGGGTQINLSIMVTGNTLQSEQDIEALTSQIARKVEESISRKTSLLGFRPSQG